jgi:enolase
VRKAVANVNGEIARAIKGKDLSQRQLDEAMIALDGTPTKSRLGANALLGVSMAALRAERRAAQPLYAHIGAARRQPDFTLPVPMMNILNGGAHDRFVTSTSRSSMVMPLACLSQRRFARPGAESFTPLRSILKGKGLSSGGRDEGGFAREPEVESRGRSSWCSRR